MALDNVNIHKVIQKSYEDAETKSNPQAELLGKFSSHRYKNHGTSSVNLMVPEVMCPMFTNIIRYYYPVWYRYDMV